MSRPSPAWHAEAIALAELGMAPRDLAPRFNVTAVRVLQVLTAAGLSGRELHRRRTKERWRFAAIGVKRAIAAGHKTTTAVAAAAGVSVHYARKAALEFGIAVPPRNLCDTRSGYTRHLLRGEKACPECKAAASRNQSQRQRRYRTGTCTRCGTRPGKAISRWTRHCSKCARRKKA